MRSGPAGHLRPLGAVGARNAPHSSQVRLVCNMSVVIAASLEAIVQRPSDGVCIIDARPSLRI